MFDFSLNQINFSWTMALLSMRLLISNNPSFGFRGFREKRHLETYGNKCGFNLCKRRNWYLLASVLASSLTASNCGVTKNCTRGDPKGFFLRIVSFFQEVIGKLRSAFFLFGNIKIGNRILTRIKFILTLIFICRGAFTWLAT